MNIYQAAEARHAVRSYLEKPIEGETQEKLSSFIESCNQESGLHMQLVLNESKAFDGFMAHYGKFSGVNNYIALIGKKSPDLDEKCEYYGEKVVLYAQTLGLNTCWVALTYSKVKSAFQINDGEKLCLIIATGYGKTQGVPHHSKTRNDVTESADNAPEWFTKGVDCALLAPTATNQQKFTLSLNGNKVTAKAGMGFYAKVDLGIVKYHFKIGAGKENFDWA